MKESITTEEHVVETTLDNQTALSIETPCNNSQHYIDEVYQKLKSAKCLFENFSITLNELENTLNILAKKIEKNLLKNTKGFVSRKKISIRIIRAHMKTSNSLTTLRGTLGPSFCSLHEKHKIYPSNGFSRELDELEEMLLETWCIQQKNAIRLMKIANQHIERINGLYINKI